MASGGSKTTRASHSEPKKRTSSVRLDSEERSSIGSSRQEDRPNNWEFSDWQPSSAYDSGKRIKKGNEEKERERGQSQDGSSQGERTRQKTPSTYPRTKMTSATPLSERLALHNLRQHLSFSDNEEITDVEKNNERFATRRKERPANCVLHDASSSTRNEMLASGGGDNNRDNRNINKEEGPDSTQIVGRLMQIRDYIKQATSMMDGLKRSTDVGDLGRARQLDQVVQRLKEQEQKYLDILLRLSGVNDFDELLRPSSTSSANNNEDESEVVSVDLDVASDTTSNTTNDLARKNDELEALRQQHALLKKMLNQQEQLRALQGRQEALLAIQREAENKLREERSNNNEAAAATSSAAAAIAAVGTANADLAVNSTAETGVSSTLMESDLVPQELRDLRQRLNYLKNIYDIKDTASGQSEDAAESEGASAAGSVMSVHRRHLEDKLRELQAKRYEMEDLMKELQELRREQKHQLQLHNELDGASTSSSQAHMLDGIIASTTATHTAKDAGEVLELLETRKKMKKLQDVRGRLNQLRDLVQYYQSGTEFIHGDGEDQSSLPAYEDCYEPVASNIRNVKPRDTVANRLKRYAEGDTSQDTSQQASETGSVQDSTDTESQTSSLAAWGEDPEVQDKVRKLKAAKEKLRRLQDLVAMVQQSPDVVNALPDDLAELAAGFDSDVLSEIAGMTQQRNRIPASGLATEDKHCQPSAVAATTAGPSKTSQASPPLALSSEERERFYKMRMQEQRDELDQLVDERRKLLAIQDQLQRLHDQIPGSDSRLESDQRNEQNNNEESEASDDNSTQLKGVNEGAQVTFQEPLATVASYDELYGQMRQQRMLREELRKKKKVPTATLR